MTQKNKPKGLATYNSVLRTQINEFIKLKLKEAGNTELVPSHGSLLSYVYENGGRVQIKELYDVMLKQKSTITEMIKRLIKLGYLTKEASAEDKRVSYVVATEKAWAFRDAFSGISEDLQDKVFTDFTDEEAEEFVRLLKKAIKNF